MERDPNNTKCYEYKLFYASERTIREDLMGELTDVYTIVGLAMTLFAGAQVILEKEANAE